MTVLEAFGLVATGVLLVAGLALAAWGARWFWRDRREQRAAIDKLVTALEKSGDGLMAVPKLYEGMIRIAETQVAETTKLREAVEVFNAALFDRPRRENPTLERYSDRVARAEREAEVQDLLRQGVPEEEARERARESEIYGQMFRR